MKTKNLMERFLKEYVKTIIKCGKYQNATNENIDEVVFDLINNDELFDTIDSYVFETLEENGIEQEKESEE